MSEYSSSTGYKKKLHRYCPGHPAPVIETRRTKAQTRREPAAPPILERNARQLLADGVCGNLVGLWLLIPEYLRLGTWDLLRHWSGCATEQVEPRIALQLVNEAALADYRIRHGRSLGQRGFELANGLPWIASDVEVHRLLDRHDTSEAQQLQIALGRIRAARGHFAGHLLAIDAHNIASYSRKQMRQHKHPSDQGAKKVFRTSFCVDAQTHQPLCLTLNSSAPPVSQSSPNVLAMAEQILAPEPGTTLVLADREYYAIEFIAHVQRQTPFELLMMLPDNSRIRRLVAQLQEQQFTRRWAGFATAKVPLELDPEVDPCWLLVQRCGETAENYERTAFLATAPEHEVMKLSNHYPARWHIEEFFNLEKGMGWRRAGTTNLNIRYGAMTASLIAQAAVHELRLRLGSPYQTWDADHLGRGLLAGLDGKIRVERDTIIVTYYNAPLSKQQRESFVDLPARLAQEGVDPHIPWLYHLKLDFCFR